MPIAAIFRRTLILATGVLVLQSKTRDGVPPSASVVVPSMSGLVIQSFGPRSCVDGDASRVVAADLGDASHRLLSGHVTPFQLLAGSQRGLAGNP
jgi:hypothetical protein